MSRSSRRGARKLKNQTVKRVVDQILPLFMDGQRGAPDGPWGLPVQDCELWLRRIAEGDRTVLVWEARQGEKALQRGRVEQVGNEGPSLRQALTDGVIFICLRR